MGVINQIKVGNESRDIACSAGNVSYTNNSLAGVDNVADALDTIISQGGSSGASSSTPRYHNHPLPYWKDNISVLCIANSFTMYSMKELYTILNGLGVASSKLTFCVAHSPARTMSTWLEKINNNNTDYQYHYVDYANGAWKNSYSSSPNGTGIRSRIGGKAWDVIVFQPYPPSGSSDNASSYSSYSSVLKELISVVRKNVPNPKVCIGMNMIWSNSQTKSTYEAGWANICKAIKSTVSDAGVDVIVPIGTSFVNAANTATFGTNHHLLMSDSTGHPAAGVARYIASCVIYETLLAPVLGQSMYGLTNIPTLTSDASQYTDAEIAVSAENIGLCHDIAMSAVVDMYTKDTTIDPITQ